MSLDLEKLSKEDLLQEILKLRFEVEKQEEETRRSQEETRRSQEEVRRGQEEVQWLRHQLSELKRMLFGSKRERFEADSTQIKIEFDEYASAAQLQDETPVKETITYEREKPAKKHTGRNRIPEHLPVVEHIIEPEEDTTEMKKIGEERTASSRRPCKATENVLNTRWPKSKSATPVEYITVVVNIILEHLFGVL